MNLPCKEVLSEREGILLLITLMSVERVGGGDPNAWAVCMMNQCVFFLIAKIFAKIRPEKYDFDQYKGFFMGKNGSKFAKFRKEKKKLKSPDFYNKFQVAKNIGGSWFFF